MLDLRLPIGYFFLINGALLVGDGLAQPQMVTLGGQMFNLDIVWGLVLFVFGAIMAGLAWNTKLRARSNGTSKPAAE